MHRLSLAVALLALAPACSSSTGRPPPAGTAAPSGTGAHHGLPMGPDIQPCEFTLTEYWGDCVVPPAVDPSQGLVAKYGPADYDNPDDVAQYIVEPGSEPLDCGYTQLPNDAAFFYNRYEVRSRPAMHHVILYASDLAAPDGTHDDCQIRDQGGRMLAVVQGGIDGGIYEYPPSGQLAPENATLATRLEPFQTIAYELHAVNATDEPLLRENWTIFWSMPPDEVTGAVEQLAFNGGLAMNIPAHTRQVISNTCTVPAKFGEVRVVDAFAHMHAHGERFSAWTVTKDTVSGAETRTLVYESYDWSLLDLIEWNSTQENAPVAYKGGVRGGTSGDLYLKAGDRLEYECEMNNTEDHSLVFAARAFEGEMCNMFGTIAPGTSGPWTCLGN